MSSGNKTVDTRHPSTRLGLYFSKVWSGTDRPGTPPAYRDVPTVVYRRVPLEAHGAGGLLMGTTREKGTRRLWVKPPKPMYLDLTDHPYTMTSVKSVDTDTRYRAHPSHDWYTGAYESLFGSYTADTTWSSSDDLRILGKLREKVAGSSFNLAVFLAEGSQALRMIANAATRIGNSLPLAQLADLYNERAVHLRKLGYPPGPIRQAEQKALSLMRAATRALGVQTRGGKVASNWLELQYGWLPLLNDAHDGAQSLAHFLNGPKTVSVRVRTRRRLQIASQSPSNTAFRVKDGFIYGQIICRLTEKDTVALLGLTDPASVIWEKLPYSFVVDWFIPIGNFLQARALAGALKGTFVKTTYWWVSIAKPYPVNPASTMQLDSNYVRSDAGLVRTVSTTLSVPLPSWKSLNQVLSWRHAANAVALMIQKTRLPILAAFR